MTFLTVSFWNAFFHQQRDRLILWAPVGIGLGILIYSSFVPFYTFSCIFIVGLGLISSGLAILYSKFFKLRILFVGIFCLSLGFITSHIRSFVATTPVLKVTPSKPVWIRGNIEEISQGINQKKLILSVKKIETIKQSLPKKVQLIYRSKKEKETKLHPGDFVVLKAKLEPLQGPLVPGGYDFRQQSLFKQIGAQGYIVYIHQVTPSPRANVIRILENYRLTLTQQFLTKLPGQEGSIASALITGDTGSLSKQTRTAFADSGTAHILAISGLHLSLIGGLLLLLTRFTVGIITPLILRIPAKKIAAVLALIGAFGYLYLSGWRIPTQRAFISFGLMMIAVLIDRNPLSMRVVAFAATTILLLSPEVLLTPSFQLSFAAVTALIAFYESVQIYAPKKSWLKRVLFYGAGILLSSIIASVATLPFTLYHFYKFTLQSIGSNLLMIPLLSFWVMPLCLCFMAFSWWPFAQHACLLLLKKGLSLMILIADTFSKLPGSLIYVPGFSRLAFGLVTFGGLILCLLKGKARWIGAGGILLGALLPFVFPKPLPFLFVAEEGRTIGVVHKNHLFISSPRTDTFLATIWSGYAGIPPDHVHKLKKKKAHPLTPPLQFYGKNFLVRAGDSTIGYAKTEEELTKLWEGSDILVAPCLKRRPQKSYGQHPDLVFWKEDLDKKAQAVFKKKDRGYEVG